MEATREQLREIANLAIEKASAHGPIPVELGLAVMDVAEHATKMAMGSDWWNEKHQCGCLVGTIYGPGIDVRKLSTAESVLGGAYIWALVDVLGHCGNDLNNVLEIVDAPTVVRLSTRRELIESD